MSAFRTGQYSPEMRKDPLACRAPQFGRRHFLKATAVMATGASGCNAAARLGADEDAARFFPQSVASGDPRPHSVVLWTRVVDPDLEGDLHVVLELALDPNFEQEVTLETRARELVAKSDDDHCVRVLLTGLEPGTVYHYRFVYEAAQGTVTSRTGRTKTAPLPDTDAVVRFAVTSCQDYSGRYYHAYRLIAEMDLDFVVHLGDYIYETADDPAFQSESEERSIAFDDVAGALQRSSDGEPLGSNLAAQSLDNYRQLYRTYRADRDLQRLHERFAMIAVWDDHEFSNDAHGASSTYSDGREAELNLERRANADQAWVEYMPIDFPAGADFRFDPDGAFPDNLRIYRELVFGQNLHLFLTDLRRYRPDHVVPENAFPAAIALPQARLEALLGSLPERAVPYVALGDAAQLELRAELESAREQGLFDAPAAVLDGELDVRFVNEMLDALDSALPRLDVEDGGFQRGIPYSELGKSETYASFGSRNFVDREVFSWLSRARYEDTSGASEDWLGAEQEQWFLSSVQDSDRTWKVWGSEFALMERRVDLRAFPVPDAFRRELLISADDWDGAPNRRAALLDALDQVDNLVVVSGDLHSFLAGSAVTPSGGRVVEFLCGAASSATYGAILEQSGLSLSGLGDIGVAGGLLLQEANPHLAYQNLHDNGLATITASRDRFDVTFHQIPFQELREPELAGTLEEHFRAERFRVERGSSALLREVEGEYRRWSEADRRWIQA